MVASAALSMHLSKVLTPSKERCRQAHSPVHNFLNAALLQMENPHVCYASTLLSFAIALQVDTDLSATLPCPSAASIRSMLGFEEKVTFLLMTGDVSADDSASRSIPFSFGISGPIPAQMRQLTCQRPLPLLKPCTLQCCPSLVTS
eukprot:1157719-Pelagomonas_calceolata.AAC.6